MRRSLAKQTKQRNTSDVFQGWDSHLPFPRISFRLASLVVFSLAVCCFMNSHNADFVFDDSEAILNNNDIHPETPLSNLFHHDFWGGKLASKTSHKSYRPLTILTFRLNRYVAGGLTPSGFHIVNIFLHGIVSVLMLYTFSVVLTAAWSHDRNTDWWNDSAPRTALLCAILFAVHPVHTESVAGVVGRADLMCAACFLLSLLAYIKACSAEGEASTCVTSTVWLAVSMLLCVASTLFKEQGITVLGICSVYDIILFCKVDLRKILQKMLLQYSQRAGMKTVNGWVTPVVIRHVFMMLTGVGIIILRFSIMGWSAPVFQLNDNPHSFVNGTLLRAFNYNYIYSMNAWLLINPWWLCFDWSMGCVPVITSFTDVRILVVVAFWVVLGWLLSRCLSSNITLCYQRLLVVVLAVLLVPFLPASNLLFRVGFVIAERVLYLPVAGFCMLVALGARQICHTHPRYKQLVRCCLIFLVVIFMARSVQRSSEWRTEKQLFESGVKVCPLNAKVHYNIAKIHSDEGNTELAIQKYRLAISLNPKYDQAMNNLGNLLKEKGEIYEAEKLLEDAVETRPDFAAAWMNLGIVQAALKKNNSAEHSYKTAIKHRRKYPDCLYNLGNLYLDIGRHEEALAAWKNATILKPTHINAWSNMLILYDNLGRKEDIEAAAVQALQHLPHEPVIYYNLANFQGKAGLYVESERNFLKAIQLDPKNAGYYSNIVWQFLLLHEQSRKKMADKRESGRIKDVNQKRILDEASRRRRQRKALEALEADNYQDDPHADLKMSKKAPKFEECMETAAKKKRKSKTDYHKQRFRKNFTALLEDEQLNSADGPNYLTVSVPASRFPERHFCAVCGFPSTYTCVQCGTKYCSIKCLGTHQDTRCLKWTA